MICIGVDPGATGGVALIDGVNLLIAPMPEHSGKLVDIFAKALPAHVFLEKAQAMPKNGAVGMFNYGTGYGIILGILIALKIPHTLVQPKTWGKVMHAGTDGGMDSKKRSVQAFLRLFPDVAMSFGNAKKPHLGAVEAALIAEYGRRTLVGAA